MPKLSTPRRERFAVDVVNTWSLEDAYERAGYSMSVPDVAAAAAALAAVPKVAARIAELQGEIDELRAIRAARARAAE